MENLNESNQTVDVEFDISWDNSWRLSSGPANWDAAWLFVKFRTSSGDWLHAQLSTTVLATPVGSVLKVSPDQVGALLYRSGDGSGTFALQDVMLTWEYPAEVSTSDILDVQVHAIEMVYVPAGAYIAGDRTSEGAFYGVGAGGKEFFTIDSEASLPVVNTIGNFYYDNLGDPFNIGDQQGPIPAAFPKGFGGFYCMKYEITQDQWVNFFNTLPVDVRSGLDITGSSYKNTDDESSRNTVAWSGGGASATTTLPYVPCGFFDAKLFLVYLDWSGLRPMTELEYEKACRGTQGARDGQLAWGSLNVNNEAYTLTNEGTASEGIANPASGTGNAFITETNGQIFGPVRVGIFAASALTKNREETGATAYGIMEMSGNQWELIVTVGNPTGRAFTGQHGNGRVGTSGEHDVPSWPVSSTGDGLAFRGGSYNWSASYARISDRTFAALPVSDDNGDYTGRGVRTDF
ncbi:MAG: SUMF1/EgtB/PvdO family nonheme iron enzyme [Bacteroidota bacterium]